MMIQVRQATIADIPRIQVIRNAVRENRLSDPALVPDSDVEDYINRRGRGWVSIEQGIITGFSIVSISDRNVWALFIHPEWEGKGAGRMLHDVMMHWYFSQTGEDCWLSTAPGTRAEAFYRKAGWQEKGTYGKGETRFEMNCRNWAALHPV